MVELLNPLSEYELRQRHWRAEQQVSQEQFIRIGNWRLIVGLVAIALALLAFGWDKISGGWVLLPLIAFVALAVWHQRVIRIRTLAERAVRYYERGLLRLRDEWAGHGETGERFRDGSHVYSEDLDVFGAGSLFELLSTARTAAGENVLARWLLSPAAREEAIDRQEAIREFRARLDLREDIALLGDDVRSGVNAEVLMKWGSRPPVLFPPIMRPVSLVLCLACLITMFAFFFKILPQWPFWLAFAGNLLVGYALRKQVSEIYGTIDIPAEDLRILGLMVARFEKETFASPLLNKMQAAMKVKGEPVAKRIHRLERWVEMLGTSSHYLMRAVRRLLLWREQVAMGIEVWRAESGERIGYWIQALGEFEAISAMAAFAFERPHWNFPELVASDGARFEAAGLQHPLIAREKCVANDVALNQDSRLLIVSGSNMSGKSTLLRSIGLNTILAWAGAPAAALQLTLSCLHTGASIRITDSLKDNRSRFFAEITRLKQIVDMTRDGKPTLFLLDELLSGTNSHDRRIGASGIVRGLLRGDSVGLLTTHDLALAEIEQDCGAHAANVHFEDRITGGGMEFDYKLRPGIVTHSNALELMRAVGLDVD